MQINTDETMTPQSRRGRILAIDYGQRRIGLAISDLLGYTAQPLPTIQVVSLQQTLVALEQIIQDKQVVEIVVGLPLNMKGEKGVAAEAVLQFVQRLQTKFPGPIHTWDERWTTVAAQRAMLQFGQSPSRRKHQVDQIAAQLILQSFLEYRRRANSDGQSPAA
ncbi:MAG: Holliday junction resolvase RuvX [candidate division KSB1 bacterium]|nr:Holliday junction resolvase RuvX [candidate division KSB1 bacterium]MDZ7319010.1 Holliday junction resolvase RuvX [candidate division KSB1 bacterium]MDZ7339798.1 Holliday junction resolvase RuvX [candidate division KSB1 bacterium]